MFAEYLKHRREKKALREWQNSRLGQMLANHTQQYFTEFPKFAGFSEAAKSKIVGGFYGQIFSLAQNENPFKAMRELLASYVLTIARFQVLCLTETEKAEAFYAKSPYISGELHHHILKAAEHVDELREHKWKHPECTSSDLVYFCNTRCAIDLYCLNGFNYVRMECDDLDRDKDWLRPFLESMLIWQEHEMRRKIGLSSLLLEEIDALKHSTFLNLVLNGHKNPYFEWETTWAEGENAQRT